MISSSISRQLACAPINSPEGQKYLRGMAAAANFAWVNRSVLTFLARQAFSKVFKMSPDDLDMQVIYDVSHNIAKVEQHEVNGKPMTLLVHRKGATRAFPPHHPLIPVDYQVYNHILFYSIVHWTTCIGWWINGYIFICISWY